MATLALTTPSIAGVLVGNVAAAGGGDKFRNDGRTLLYVNNGGGGPINVTIDAQSIDGMPFEDPVVAVAAGAHKLIGPFPPRYFNDAGGFVNVSYSGVSSVTVAAIQLL